MQIKLERRRVSAAMTRMHLMWFCAFSPHAGFGLDGWTGPRTSGYEWTRAELWQDMAVALERAKFDLIMLGDSLAVPGTYQGRMDAYLRYAEHAPFPRPGAARRHHGGSDVPYRPRGNVVDHVLPAIFARPSHDDARPP